jgi:hypothetical protein
MVNFFFVFCSLQRCVFHGWHFGYLQCTKNILHLVHFIFMLFSVCDMVLYTAVLTCTLVAVVCELRNSLRIWPVIYNRGDDIFCYLASRLYKDSNTELCEFWFR